MSHNNGSHAVGHIQPKSVYINILIILLVLTIITVGVSRIDFGNFNIVVALIVASIKAVLVMLFFMHLKFEDKVVWMYAAIPIILIFIMIGGVYTDNPFREDEHGTGAASGSKVEAPAHAEAGHH